MIHLRLTDASNLPIGFASFILVLLSLNLKNVITEDRKLPVGVKMRRLDLLGAAILISGLCCLLLALQWGGTSLPWRSSRIIGLLTGSGLIIVCFFLLQWKIGDNATMPLHVLFQRSVAFGSGFELSINMSNYAVKPPPSLYCIRLSLKTFLDRILPPVLFSSRRRGISYPKWSPIYSVSFSGGLGYCYHGFCCDKDRYLCEDLFFCLDSASSGE